MPPSSPIDHKPGVEGPTPARKQVRKLRYDCSISYKAIESAICVLDKTVRRIYNAKSSRQRADNVMTEERRGKKSLISSK